MMDWSGAGDYVNRLKVESSTSGIIKLCIATRGRYKNMWKHFSYDIKTKVNQRLQWSNTPQCPMRINMDNVLIARVQGSYEEM